MNNGQKTDKSPQNSQNNYNQKKMEFKNALPNNTNGNNNEFKKNYDRRQNRNEIQTIAVIYDEQDPDAIENAESEN